MKKSEKTTKCIIITIYEAEGVRRREIDINMLCDAMGRPQEISEILRPLYSVEGVASIFVVSAVLRPSDKWKPATKKWA